MFLIRLARALVLRATCKIWTNTWQKQRQHAVKQKGFSLDMLMKRELLIACFALLSWSVVLKRRVDLIAAIAVRGPPTSLAHTNDKEGSRQ